MKTLVRIAAFSFLCLAATAGAAAPPRAPTGKWAIDLAQRKCAATHDFGAAGDPLILAFRPSLTGQSMQIALAFKEPIAFDTRDAPVTVRIDELPPIETRLVSFRWLGEEMRQIQINLPAAAVAPLRQATSLSIVAPGHIEERFVLREMPAVMAEMDRCLRAVQTEWHIGEPAQARLKSPARPHMPHLASYISDSDYPEAAMREGKDGVVAFLLLVDEAGLVADCAVTESSGVPALDAQTCRVMGSRPRFWPATGADGKAAKDMHAGRIRWVLPRSGKRGR